MRPLALLFALLVPWSASASSGPTDPRELEAFLDGLMAAHLEDYQVAGAAVSVVRGEEVLLAKGYGLADVEGWRPVEADETLFRIGSVTKLFTWTAVMQLVERGLLDLDADVNGYLDFEIPPTYPEPITLNHLLTHTAGFEDRVFGLFAARALDLVATGEWLADNIPERVRPPGRFSAYSNYGTALAGYIVGRVAGSSWEAYVEEHILQPLGMARSSPRQPLPPSLEPSMSTGYSFEDGRFVAQGFELIRGAAPAGSMSSTATDMARFMIAHLAGGRFGERRILEEETAGQMHSPLFRHDPRVNGFCHGFYELSSHGQRIIGHGGDTTWFHSLLALFPERKLGLFVSYNSGRGGELSSGPFLGAFLDHYFPIDIDEPVRPIPASVQRAALVDGTYRMNRSSFTTFEKVLGLFLFFDLRSRDDGTLMVRSPLGSQRLREKEPYVFTDLEGQNRLVIGLDEKGRVRYGFFDRWPVFALEKHRWYESPRLHLTFLALCFLVFSSVLARVLVGGWRWLRSDSWDLRPSVRWWVAAALSGSAMAFLVGLAAVGGNQASFVSGQGLATLRVVLVFPLMTLLLTLVLGALLPRIWRDPEERTASRWGYAGLVVVALGFVLFAAYWNLLGWQF